MISGIVRAKLNEKTRKEMKERKKREGSVLVWT